MHALEEISVQLNGQTVVLHASGAMWVPACRWLVIADAHFSKESHFRKHGIAIPSGVLGNDLQRLQEIMTRYQPERLVFLGDMFHSHYNKGVDQFIAWRKGVHTEFHLIRGNHDILHAQQYADAGLIFHQECLSYNGLVFSHERIAHDRYNIHGHVHPCIRLSGKARQSLRFPCFLFSEEYAILPAFGSFTGGYTIAPASSDKVVMLTPDGLMDVST